MSSPGAHRSASADEALTRIQDGIDRARERAERATEFRQQYESLDASAHSRQDGVRVTVDANGLLTALSITDRGASRSGRQVAAAVLRVHDEAVDQLRDAAERLATDAFGPAAPATSALLGEMPDRDRDEPPQRSTW